ncbi:MAG: diguanylate cyclase and metal dependent phosphohydrolase [Firmicutes bacterium]|nr:diguanylate cyclase and metal dependent phosphohydrolase [Bacillota bacterium]
MLRINIAGKYIKYLVIVAVLLPLIFIAEVTYVETQHIKDINQAQTEELTKRRVEAEAVWLASQVAYVRGIAKVSAVTVDEQEAVSNEFHTFRTNDFITLGYVENNGKIKSDTGGSSSRIGRDISDRNYEQQEVGRWLAWLGGVYFIGLIPLLFLVYLLRRHKLPRGTPAAAVPQKPVADKKRLITIEDKMPANRQRLLFTDDQEPASVRKELADATAVETPEAIAVRKIAAIIAADTDTISNPADATPAAVIDRVLAVAAYKGIKTTANQPPASSLINEPVPTVVSECEPKSEQPVIVQEFKADLPALDALTGLYTQSEFEKKIAAQQTQPDSAIVVLSIDGMKVINDFLGKPAGDTLITVTADIVKTVAGPGCIAARFAGDRFAALVTGVSPDMLKDIKQDIKYYSDLHNLRQPELPLSITTGVAAAELGESLTAVWAKADHDMESRKAINRVEARKFIMLSIKRQRQKP